MYVAKRKTSLIDGVHFMANIVAGSVANDIGFKVSLPRVVTHA